MDSLFILIPCTSRAALATIFLFLDRSGGRGSKLNAASWLPAKGDEM